jgi:hypothetical protein
MDCDPPSIQAQQQTTPSPHVLKHRYMQHQHMHNQQAAPQQPQATRSSSNQFAALKLGSVGGSLNGSNSILMLADPSAVQVQTAPSSLISVASYPHHYAMPTAPPTGAGFYVPFESSLVGHHSMIGQTSSRNPNGNNNGNSNSNNSSNNNSDDLMGGSNGLQQSPVVTIH